MNVKAMNEKSKYDFLNYLDNAIDKIDQAIPCISYSSYPERNKKIIDELQEISYRLEELKNSNIEG
jgi:hypothetical protein